MGAYQQVFVGGMLLLAAFFFGKFVTNGPPDSTPATEATAEKPEQLQLRDTPLVSKSPTNDPNAVQRSLRDRILGERAKNDPDRLQSPVATDKAVSSAADSRPVEAEIVVPDFSFLQQQLAAESSSRMNWQPDSNPPATEDRGFDALPRKPMEIRSARFSIPPPRPDVTTQRAVIKPGTPTREMVPVQRRQNRLTLENMEFVDYTTEFGDTLHSLSNRFFGTTDHYLDIYLANRQLFENPSEVPVNTTIRIPVPRLQATDSQDRRYP